ncbi:MAG: hypothetical protein ACXWKR_00705 [Phenylobacterium sp.]
MASVASYGGLSLIQGQLAAVAARAVTPAADAASVDDQPQPAAAQTDAATATQSAVNLAASDANLTPASMAALIQAQASITQGAPAMIRQHTAERIGEMIWRLDDSPALSPAPFAVRQLQAARKALSESLVDLRA